MDQLDNLSLSRPIKSSLDSRVGTGGSSGQSHLATPSATSTGCNQQAIACEIIRSQCRQAS